MTLSAHNVLAKLAGHERSRAEEALGVLAARRQALLDQRATVLAYLRKLETQREQALVGGTQASMLSMMDAAMQEQHDKVDAIQTAMTAIHEQEQQLIQGWISASRKNMVHEKMQKISDKKEQRSRDRRDQQTMDDMCAARSREERTI